MRRDDAERFMWSVIKIELVIVLLLATILLFRAVQHT